jgi:hypothetical protein
MMRSLRTLKGAKIFELMEFIVFLSLYQFLLFYFVGCALDFVSTIFMALYSWPFYVSGALLVIVLISYLPRVLMHASDLCFDFICQNLWLKRGSKYVLNVMHDLTVHDSFVRQVFLWIVHRCGQIA